MGKAKVHNKRVATFGGTTTEFASQVEQFSIKGKPEIGLELDGASKYLLINKKAHLQEVGNSTIAIIIRNSP